MQDVRAAILVALPFVLAAGPAWAQTAPRAGAPTEPQINGGGRCQPGTPAPEQHTLSEKLENCNGVLRPSSGIDSKMRVPAPDPHAGTMRVIRPDSNAPVAK